eukprot:scaffold156230_cov20-Cyclotella_meneghiniana.AAC.1
MTRQHRHSSLGRDRAKSAKNVKKDLRRILLLLDEWNKTEDGVLLELLRKRQETTESRQEGASNRKFVQRISWEKFQRRLTDKQFRRYFICMNKSLKTLKSVTLRVKNSGELAIARNSSES